MPGGDQAQRAPAPQVLGAVMRRYRDFDAAEDAVQEALVAASSAWPREGKPADPRAWLIQVAFRRLTDQARADATRKRREDAFGDELREDFEATVPAAATGDDTLLLLFMCCHPSLTPPSAIALTLRAVGGLTTAEIAKAFLVPEATMAQRISRAKQTVRPGMPFSAPPDEWLALGRCSTCCTSSSTRAHQQLRRDLHRPSLPRRRCASPGWCARCSPRNPGGWPAR